MNRIDGLAISWRSQRVHSVTITGYNVRAQKGPRSAGRPLALQAGNAKSYRFRHGLAERGPAENLAFFSGLIH